MPRSLQEMASRWCHRSVCLVLTIDVYGSGRHGTVADNWGRIFVTNFVILSSEIKTGFFFIKATLYACKEGGNSGQGLSQAIIIIIIIII